MAANMRLAITDRREVARVLEHAEGEKKVVTMGRISASA